VGLLGGGNGKYTLLHDGSPPPPPLPPPPPPPPHQCSIPETVIKVLEIFINTLLLSLAPERFGSK